MPLSDSAIRSAKPSDKPRRLFDAGGLYLEVSPAGGKLWRLKYRFGGKEKRLALGAYPVIGLKDARDKRDKARKLLDAGVDPSEQRKAEKAAGGERAANSFEVVAREWFAKQSTLWAPNHAGKIIARLERDLFPWLGARPIADITAPELLKVLRRIEDRGALETAHRAVQNCGQIFRYAIQTGRAERDPAADLRGPPIEYPAASCDIPETALRRGFFWSKNSHIPCLSLLPPKAGTNVGENYPMATWSVAVSAPRRWETASRCGHGQVVEPHTVSPRVEKRLSIVAPAEDAESVCVASAREKRRARRMAGSSS